MLRYLRQKSFSEIRVLTRENYGLLSTKYSTTKKKQTNVIDKVQKKLGSAAILLTLILLTH